MKLALFVKNDNKDLWGGTPKTNQITLEPATTTSATRRSWRSIVLRAYNDAAALCNVTCVSAGCDFKEEGVGPPDMAD